MQKGSVVELEAEAEGGTYLHLSNKSYVLLYMHLQIVLTILPFKVLRQYRWFFMLMFIRLFSHCNHKYMEMCK